MQRLLSFLALSSYARAAILSPAGMLVERQDASSSSSEFSYSTLGYSSVSMEGESTVWAPYTYDPTEEFIVTSRDYYGECYWSYTYFSVGTSYSYSTISSACPIYTSCSLGIMLAADTTAQCAGRELMCATNLLYDSWGASDAATEVGCYYTTARSNSTVISMFKTKPADVVSSEVPTTTTLGTTLASTLASTPSPARGPTTPIASETAAASKGNGNGGGGGSNNTGVIAGATIGGIAVLGAIGVAVLYILKRSKPHEHRGPTVNDYPIYQPEKPGEGHQHYDGHQSALYSQGTGSPHPHSPAPAYPEGHTRGELSGVMSPPPPQPQAGSPNLAVAPPAGYH